MGKILVIDDYPAVLQMMDYYLPTFGHTVVLAADGPTGLRRAAEESVDLVLVDLDMPRMTGLRVCEELKRDPSLRHLPVILMTGRLTREVAALARAAGIVMIVGKPFEWSELTNSIAQLLAPTKPPLPLSLTHGPRMNDNEEKLSD